MKLSVKICAVVAGTVFILSGLGKSLAVFKFAAIVEQYGAESAGFLAPVVAIAETVAGLCLFFNIGRKTVAGISMLLLAGLTAVYLYGYFFRGVEDCGCFGAFSALNLPFGLTLARNATLFVLLFAPLKYGNNAVQANRQEKAVAVAVLCTVSFLSGFSYYEDSGRTETGSRYAGKTVQNTPLSEFVETSKDSTYLIFAFMYTCRHCLNSVENLKRYEPSGTVDKVVALTLSDSAGSKFFVENFNPNFVIREYDAVRLFRLTNSFPMAFYVRNNIVETVLTGELPCSYVFSSKIKKNY